MHEKFIHQSTLLIILTFNFINQEIIIFIITMLFSRFFYHFYLCLLNLFILLSSYERKMIVIDDMKL